MEIVDFLWAAFPGVGVHWTQKMTSCTNQNGMPKSQTTLANL